MGKHNLWKQTSKKLIYFIVSLSLIISLHSCTFPLQYSLGNYFLIEGNWTYKHIPDDKNWSIARQVIEEKKEDKTIWYKVKETKQDLDQHKTSTMIWYSHYNHTIYSKILESDEPKEILKLPGGKPRRNL